MLIAFENPLNESALAFPILECFHILGFAMTLGTIALVDFRLLGFGLRRQNAAELAKALAPWTLFGLITVLLSGPMLFSSDPDMYYLNLSFQIKMVLLAIALICLATSAHQGWSANLFTTASDVFPKQAVASVTGIGGTLGGLGGFLFSAIIPGIVVTHFGYTPLILGFGFFHLAALLLVHRFMGNLKRVDL